MAFDEIGKWVIQNWQEIARIDRAVEEAESQCQGLVSSVEQALAGEKLLAQLKRSSGKDRVEIWKGGWEYRDKKHGFGIILKNLTLKRMMDGDPVDGPEPPWIGVRWEGPPNAKGLNSALTTLRTAATAKGFQTENEDPTKKLDVCWKYLTDITPEALVDRSAVTRLAGELKTAFEELEAAVDQAAKTLTTS